MVKKTLALKKEEKNKHIRAPKLGLISKICNSWNPGLGGSIKKLNSQSI
jgi:hypothetical protein